MEAAMGMFHTQVNATEMVFINHLGTSSSEDFSLHWWMDELDQDPARLWDRQKNHVKNFRSCDQFINILLDGYVSAAFASSLGYANPDELLKALPELSADKLKSSIEELADRLCTFDSVRKLRKEESKLRDAMHENNLLFMQQAIVLRSFAYAMRVGDPGMVIVGLRYLTIWFQASSKHKYALETIRLTACLAKLWGPEMCKHWMHTCLINPSGKREGFMACDYLGEYIVREFQDLMHNTLNEKTSQFLQMVLAPLIMVFLNLRRQMMEAFGYYRSTHSSSVTTFEDVRAAAIQIMKRKASQYRPNRADSREVTDLHGGGLSEFYSLKPLTNWKKSFKEEHGVFESVRPKWRSGEAGASDVPDGTTGNDEIVTEGATPNDEMAPNDEMEFEELDIASTLDVDADVWFENGFEALLNEM